MDDVSYLHAKKAAFQYYLNIMVWLCSKNGNFNQTLGLMTYDYPTLSRHFFVFLYQFCICIIFFIIITSYIYDIPAMNRDY